MEEFFEKNKKWIFIGLGVVAVGIVIVWVWKSKNEKDEFGALSFQSDIRPLFNQSDIDTMKSIGGFDLSNYEDVKTRSEDIYSRLSDKSMPCEGGWPGENIEKFKRWMDTGANP